MQAIEKMKQAENGMGDPLQADLEFHIQILEAANNRFLVQLEGLLETALTFAVRNTNLLKGVRLAYVDDHNRVAQAIMDGDSELARKSMELMLEDALATFESCQEQESD